MLVKSCFAFQGQNGKCGLFIYISFSIEIDYRHHDIMSMYLFFFFLCLCKLTVSGVRLRVECLKTSLLGRIFWCGWLVICAIFWFHRNIQFFGLEPQQKVTASYVVVIGLGGVGSHAASMLLRSGIGKLLLVDFDQVSLCMTWLLLILLGLRSLLSFILSFSPNNVPNSMIISSGHFCFFNVKFRGIIMLVLLIWRFKFLVIYTQRILGLHHFLCFESDHSKKGFIVSQRKSKQEESQEFMVRGLKCEK